VGRVYLFRRHRQYECQRRIKLVIMLKVRESIIWNPSRSVAQTPSTLVRFVYLLASQILRFCE